MLSDWNAEATHGFQVAFEYRGLRDVSQRTVFLVDGQGVVRGAWDYGTSEVPDFDTILAATKLAL